MTNEELIEKFLCVGCVSGSDTKCGRFKLNTSYGASCTSHVLGTRMMGAGTLALGLPTGFNRPPPEKAGPDSTQMKHSNTMEIRLWAKGTAPEWNNLNVPVWALEKDGFLFVRTLAPRVGRLYVDVIEGGTLGMTAEQAHGVLHAIDVSKFIDEID